MRKRGIRTFFWVGYAIPEPVRRAIRAVPDRLWHPALDQDGTLRDGAEVAELTGMVDLDGYPAGTRIIVRRERPHPGAQLSLFDQDEGLRHQVFLTDTPYPGAVPPSSWRSATAGMPPSRTTSGAARPPASAAFPPATSPSTRPGSNSASRRSTCWPGCASCCWTGNWPPPSRRSSATDCCTRRPPHPRRPTPALADIADLALETRTGHGFPPPHRTVPPRWLTSKPLTAHDPRDLGEPDHRAGTPPCPTAKSPRPPDSYRTATPHHPNRNGEARAPRFVTSSATGPAPTLSGADSGL